MVTPSETMQAVVLTRYGERGVLELRDVPRPVPGPGAVLVRVYATTINDWDWSYMRGKPYPLRLFMGMRAPKVSILGAEVAGRVEEVGDGVSAFRVGDAVYGDLSEAGFGGFAEYVATPVRALTRMPQGMTFEQAASVPHAFALAWQGLVDEGGLREGQRVLINGAGGGVGTFGVQIATSFGAEVTGVDSAAKLPSMRELGYSRVIDYRAEDFTRSRERYDLILDAKSNRPPRSYRRVLEPEGSYITVGGELLRLAQVFFAGKLSTRLGGPRMRVLALVANRGLDEANRMFEAGRLRFALDGPYALADVPEAMRRFGAARHVGKVVVQVAEGSR